MKIAMIGAPGSGKTWVASRLAQYLSLKHIETDAIFWQNGKEISFDELKEQIIIELKTDGWILDGQVGKLSEIVLPAVDKLIVVEYPDFLSLLRSARRDRLNFRKLYFNIQNYQKLKLRREKLIEEFSSARPQDVIRLNNFPNLSESKLAALSEDLKFSAVKSKKKPVQRKSP